MSESYTGKKRVRKNFGRIDAVMDMPNLIDVQTGSYSSFINNIDAYGDHCEFGLEEVFKSIFPIVILPVTVNWNLSDMFWISRNMTKKNVSAAI